MPKDDLVRMTCGFCGNTDTFNVRENADILIPILKRWHGYVRGDKPPGQGADGMEWYDSIDCMLAGIRRDNRREEDATEHQEKLDAALDKANKELKASPYMVKH